MTDFQPPVFQDSLNQFQFLINEYITIRNLLFANYLSYKSDPDIKRYNVREMMLTLDAAISKAQETFAFYNQFFSKSALSPIQSLAVQSKLAGFTNQCDLDHIDYRPFTPKLSLNPDYHDSARNLRKTERELHLYEKYINGFAKINRAVYGKYPNVVISQTGYFGLMGYDETLTLDFSELDGNFEILGHVEAHEVGHADYDQYMQIAKKPINVTNLGFWRPSYITDLTNQDKKNEILADVTSAISATIFNIPLDDVYTRFSSFPKGPSLNNQTHPSSEERAQIVQEVVSRTYQHIGPENKFGENCRWKKLTDEVRAIAQIDFTQFPTHEQIDAIYQAFPNNKTLQLLELKQQFPSLFTPAMDGTFPSQIWVRSNLMGNIARLMNSKLIAPNTTKIDQSKCFSLINATEDQQACFEGLMSIEAFQEQADLYANVEFSTLNTSIPGIVYVAPPTPDVFAASVSQGLPIFPPQAMPLRLLPEGTSLGQSQPIQQQQRRFPIFPSPPVARPILSAPQGGKSMRPNFPPRFPPFGRGVRPYEEAALTPATSDVVSQNAMLVTVLGKMAKNTLSFLAPRWTASQESVEGIQDVDMAVDGQERVEDRQGQKGRGLCN